MCRFLINFARENNIPVFVDPKGIYWSKYEDVTCITPNLKEFKELAINFSDTEITEEEEKTAKDIIELFNLKNLLITKGKDGMSLYKEDGHFLHLPTEAEEVFDVSGAGDTVIAVLAAMYCCGNSIEDSVIIANKAAKYVVKKKGTRPITYEELVNEISETIRGV